MKLLVLLFVESMLKGEGNSLDFGITEKLQNKSSSVRLLYSTI